MCNSSHAQRFRIHDDRLSNTVLRVYAS